MWISLSGQAPSTSSRHAARLFVALLFTDTSHIEATHLRASDEAGRTFADPLNSLSTVRTYHSHTPMVDGIEDLHCMPRSISSINMRDTQLLLVVIFNPVNPGERHALEDGLPIISQSPLKLLVVERHESGFWAASIS